MTIMNVITLLNILQCGQSSKSLLKSPNGIQCIPFDTEKDLIRSIGLEDRILVLGDKSLDFRLGFYNSTYLDLEHNVDFYCGDWKGKGEYKVLVLRNGRVVNEAATSDLTWEFLNWMSHGGSNAKGLYHSFIQIPKKGFFKDRGVLLQLFAFNSTSVSNRYIWSIFLVVFTIVGCICLIKYSIDLASYSKIELNRDYDNKMRTIIEEVGTKFNLLNGNDMRINIDAGRTLFN